MKLKLLVTALSLVGINAFAGTTDLRSADLIICKSDSLGTFAIANIKSEPVWLRNGVRTPVIIKSLKSDSMRFKYESEDTLPLKLNFLNTTQPESFDDGNQTSVGVFTTGSGTQFVVECDVN